MPEENTVPTSLEQLRWERRRKLQVRETFTRGLAQFRATPGEPADFYLACADYLIAGQRRLIDQDWRLVEMLAPRVPRQQEDDHRSMQALRDRLDLADRSLKEFESGATELRQSGGAGRERFEAAATRFLEVLVNVLGTRSHSLRHLTTTLLTEDDWRGIAGVTPDFVDEEERSFARVGELAPPGLRPEMMSTGDPGGSSATAGARAP
jgi:hypothetical protein